MKEILKAIVLFFFLMPVLSACGKPQQYYEEQGAIFHTRYSIKYKASESLSEKIEQELLLFDASMNPFNPSSVIAKVNNNEPVKVDKWFTEVFNRAMEVSATTGGVFDITCAPMVNLWGFGAGQADEVSQAKIDSIKAFVGYEKARIKNGQVEKDDPRLTLNCSAIAKGYACDVIAALLQRNGVENYMVEIGGEVAMKGVNPKGKCWRIGINKPIDDPSSTISELQEVVSICDGAMATSGNYRNFRVKDGKKYGHTIDPRTGRPTEGSLLSVTIIAKDCMTADAYATALLVWGKEGAERLAPTLPDKFEYYLIYVGDDGRYAIAMSEGMRQYIVE